MPPKRKSGRPRDASPPAKKNKPSAGTSSRKPTVKPAPKGKKASGGKAQAAGKKKPISKSKTVKAKPKASPKSTKKGNPKPAKSPTTSPKKAAAASGSKSKAASSKTTPVIPKASPQTGASSLSTLVTDETWKSHLATEFQQDYFAALEKQLDADAKKKKQIFPPRELIFNAFNLTPIDEVKVLILGQDPYHDDGQVIFHHFVVVIVVGQYKQEKEAHGLSFSVPDGIPIPSSLRNVFKELTDDIPGFTAPSHGCLEAWAKQGILMLNATLTVEAHQPNSHAKYGWQTFTDHVIQIISDHCRGVVFILWGGFAHKKEKLIDNTKHSIIKTAHPSGLSYSKFKGCKCFSAANDALKKHGKKPIKWNL